MHVDNTEMVERILFCIMITALLSGIWQVTERQKLISISHTLCKEFAFGFVPFLYKMMLMRDLQTGLLKSPGIA